MASPVIAIRGSSGLGLLRGIPVEGRVENFETDTSKNCKDMLFTKNGDLFAWCNGQKVQIVSTSSYASVSELDKPRTASIDFSPKGTYLATWEPYTAVKGANPQENCNLHIWDVHKGTLLKSFIQKRQSSWKPLWTDDEHVCARSVNNEVHFFENGEFGNIAKKIFMQKVANFSISCGPPPYHVACYVPGLKGQPSFVRLFVYPKFEGAGAVIAQKSFFKADRTEFFWNKSGSDLILQTTVDVDKSGASYYGEQNLYHLSVKGETAKVMLGKEGPIYSFQWSPKGTEFCAVYGFMPAKATIYNLKCEPVFDFGTGPRNEIHYSPLGNRLTICGFGNLRGNIEVWDLGDKKQISKFVASDSTCLTWGSDGEHILTATTSPRLRIGNGYRIWHYTGSLMQEIFLNSTDELWDIKWKPFPEGTFKEKTTQYTPVPGITSSVPEASKQAYRPPGARGQPSTFKLHEQEPPSSVSQNGNVAENKGMSKNKKKNLAKKAKKEQEKQEKSVSNATPVVPKKELEKCVDEAPQQTEVWHAVGDELYLPDAYSSESTGNPEKDKRIKALQKKIDQIKKLKEDKASGKKLEKNQEDKINKESELIEELEKLRL